MSLSGTIFTVKEASERYFQGKVSAREIYALCKSKKIRSFRVGTKILIRESALDEYVKRQEGTQEPSGPEPSAVGRPGRRQSGKRAGLQVLDWPE